MPGRQVVIIGEVYDPMLSAGMPLPPGGGSGSPPGIWGGLPWPTPPIDYPPPGGSGGTPPGFWGGGPHPAPPIHYPGQPPASGGSPPGIWGGPPAYVDIGGPLPQPTPGWPPVAMPPIYIPPDETPPPPGDGNTPAHPIYLPPEQGADSQKVLVYAYVPGHGGTWFLIEVPEQVPPTTPTPKPKG